MATQANGLERTLAYRVLRYMPNLVRDEWLNIGVLVFNPRTGERRLRLIEEPEEYAGVRPLHPRADEGVYVSRRSHARGSRVPAKRHTRLRANIER